MLRGLHKFIKDRSWSRSTLIIFCCIFSNWNDWDDERSVYLASTKLFVFYNSSCLNLARLICFYNIPEKVTIWSKKCTGQNSSLIAKRQLCDGKKLSCVVTFNSNNSKIRDFMFEFIATKSFEKVYSGSKFCHSALLSIIVLTITIGYKKPTVEKCFLSEIKAFLKIITLSLWSGLTFRDV